MCCTGAALSLLLAIWAHLLTFSKACCVFRQLLSAFGESELDNSPYLDLMLQYLSNQTGSASAGFYIESMNVLWKWRHPKLSAKILRLPRPARQNALGVLASYQLRPNQGLNHDDQDFWFQAQACITTNQS